MPYRCVTEESIHLFDFLPLSWLLFSVSALAHPSHRVSINPVIQLNQPIKLYTDTFVILRPLSGSFQVKCG